MGRPDKKGGVMEYFIVANSFAAPFFSDQSDHFQEAPDPVSALELFFKSYKHPCGLYAAACYENANAYHKNGKVLARWLCNQALYLEKHKHTSFYQSGPGDFVLDGKPVKIKNPKHGAAHARES